MPLKPIETASFQKIAQGIDRPEDVVVSAAGRVFASDHQCAVAEILPDGSFVRMGPRGGAPNGINMDLQGRILIANFGIYDREEGPLQRFDPATGVHETLVAEVGGRRLTSANYPVMDRDGNIWCANSTHAETWPQALDGRADGFIFVLRPDGSCENVAEGLKFPNGIALPADHKRTFRPQTPAPHLLALDYPPGRLPGRRGTGYRRLQIRKPRVLGLCGGCVVRRDRGRRRNGSASWRDSPSRPRLGSHGGCGRGAGGSRTALRDW